MVPLHRPDARRRLARPGDGGDARDGGDQSAWRWVAAVFVALMALLELALMAATRLRPQWFVPARALSGPTDS